jgi:hypothetical protein
MPDVDMTNQYNTPLNANQETAFQKWATDNPRLGNTYDYDARGFWLNGAGAADNGHGSDQWKKPNHPTFSTGSQYSGVDGYVGGQWTQAKDGSYSYIPSKTNLDNLSPSELTDYFQKVEPGNRLILSPEVEMDAIIH